MKLEEQVCSLELAKRLKELGVKQDSCFYWANIGTRWLELKRYGELVKRNGSWFCPSSLNISAFTVAELGDMLPWAFWKDGVEYWLIVERLSHGWWIRYDENTRKSKTIAAAVDKTEANARAKTFIYLLENKLINLPDHETK